MVRAFRCEKINKVVGELMLEAAWLYFCGLLETLTYGKREDLETWSRRSKFLEYEDSFTCF